MEDGVEIERDRVLIALSTGIIYPFFFEFSAAKFLLLTKTGPRRPAEDDKTHHPACAVRQVFPSEVHG